MRFLVDECVGPAVAAWLRSESHDVFSVYDEARGMTDEQVLAKSFAEGRILITIDKDFGERVYRDQQPHCGVILLRLADQRSAIKIEALRNLSPRSLNNYRIDLSPYPRRRFDLAPDG